MVKTETWAPGFPFMPTLTSGMTESVQFTHGRLLQPDDLWAGSHAFFRLAQTPNPRPCLGYGSPWLGPKALRPLHTLGNHSP